jgi:hypothetical protein
MHSAKLISMVVYKIKRLSDGKFSAGSHPPRFSRTGKAWASIGNLKRHLKMFYYRNWPGPYEWKLGPYEGCVIVRIEETEHEPLSVSEFVEKEYGKEVPN